MKICHLPVILPVLLILFFLTSCSNGTENKQIDFDILTSENTVPESFDMGNEKYIVQKANSETEFKSLWEFYGFKSTLPIIDFEKQDVFFIGTHESSNCPLELKKENIAFDLNNASITLNFPDKYGPCFLNAFPKAFVMKIDQDVSTKIKQMIILENDRETSISLIN